MSKEHYAKHREACKLYSREYRLKHKGERKLYIEKYRAEHQQEIKLQRKGTRKQLKLEILSHYSNGTPKCIRCGLSDIDVLCIDHINGGGYQHKKQIGGGSKFYYWLKVNDFPDGYQVLCCNCNIKKQMVA